MNAKGIVHKYGDNIDTDVIIPARHLNTQDHKELASHCMEDIDTSFITRVKPGDIMVGGYNFGADLLVSMRRSPLRRAVFRALSQKPLREFFTAIPLTSVYRFWSVRLRATRIDAGDEVEIDFDTGVITNLTKNETYQAQAFPPFIQNIIHANGYLNSVKNK